MTQRSSSTTDGTQVNVEHVSTSARNGSNLSPFTRAIWMGTRKSPTPESDVPWPGSTNRFIALSHQKRTVADRQNSDLYTSAVCAAVFCHVKPRARVQPL